MNDKKVPEPIFPAGGAKRSQPYEADQEDTTGATHENDTVQNYTAGGAQGRQTDEVDTSQATALEELSSDGGPKRSSCRSLEGADKVDTTRADKSNVMKLYEILLICFSVLLYIADVGSDCSLAYTHYLDVEDHPLHFVFTVAFVVLSGTVTCMFNLWMYCSDYKKMKTRTNPDQGVPPSRRGLAIRIIASVFWMGPVARCLDAFIYGIQSRKRDSKQKYYYKKMLDECLDGAMLHLLEAFLESAPQFILQVYIVLKNGLDGNYLVG